VEERAKLGAEMSDRILAIGGQAARTLSRLPTLAAT
jgi:hypothetical protein